MSLETFRLVPRPGTGFRFGRAGMELETSVESFPSDSLFAALVSTYAALYSDVDDFLADYQADPSFIVSSLFPYVGDIPLFPMPRLRVELSEDMRAKAGKALKKLRYVSATILGSLLRGEQMDRAFTDEGKLIHSLQGGKVWLDISDQAGLPEKLEDGKIWEDDKPVTRVTIDRVTNSSQVYLAGRTIFAKNCGLWLLVDVHHEADILQELLTELSVEGIGGERSAGYGAFTLQDGLPLPVLPAAENSPKLLTLSRYSPTLDELQAGVLGSEAAYDLTTVGGWLASPGMAAQRRQQATLLEVGSVFQNIEQATYGRLVDVRPSYDMHGAPPHPIYRNGFALTVGVEKVN